MREREEVRGPMDRARVVSYYTPHSLPHSLEFVEHTKVRVTTHLWFLSYGCGIGFYSWALGPS